MNNIKTLPEKVVKQAVATKSVPLNQRYTKSASSAKSILPVSSAKRPSLTQLKITVRDPREDFRDQHIKHLRKCIGFTQMELAPLLRVSHRTLLSMEGGKKTIGQREWKAFVELKRLVSGLSEIMREEEVGKWLKTPNDAFGGFKPLELLDRGEVDRIYEMIYMLKAGIPG